MTSNPTPPLYSPASPMWLASFWFDQQMRMFQMMSELMLKSNPWIILAEAGTVNPLTADAALGTGDLPDEINLESGVAASSKPAGLASVVEFVPAEASEAPAAEAAEPVTDEAVSEPAPPPEPETQAAPVETSATDAAAEAVPEAPAKPATTKAAQSAAAAKTRTSEAKPAPARKRSTTAARKPAAAKTAAAKTGTTKAGAAKAVSPRGTASAASRGRRKPAAPPTMSDGSKRPDDQEK